MPERIVDCHTHTSFSDGHSTFEENLAAAAAAGCTLLVSTDHLCVPEWFAPDIPFAIPQDRLAEQVAAVRAAQAAGAEQGVEVVFGYECDWYEGCEENIARWRGDATFLLGSVHFIDQHPVDPSDAQELWDDLTMDDVWDAYAERWVKACFSPAGFDSMAHPDLPRLLEAQGFPHTRPLEGHWDRMAEAAREAGVHVEVSTGGLRKAPLGAMYPSPDLLGRFFRAGVPITIASDSHYARDIAYGFDEACRHAYEAGYRTYDAPCAEGGWRTYRL